MRLLVLSAATIVMALAACESQTRGGSDGASEANSGHEQANAASETNASAEQAGLAEWRQSLIDGCVAGGRSRVGDDPNVPVERHCTCAVDRELEGRTLAEVEEEARTGTRSRDFSALMRQCISEISSE